MGGRTEAISPSSRGKGVTTSESRNEDVKPVRADELRSKDRTAQLNTSVHAVNAAFRANAPNSHVQGMYAFP